MTAAHALNPGAHPHWCDPRACDTVAGDVRHYGTPTVHRPADDDADVAVSLYRDDYASPDGARLITEHKIHLAVTHTESTRPGGGPIAADTVLLPHEAEALAADLIAKAALARAATAGGA